MNEFIPAKNIGQGLSLLKAKVMSLQLDAEGFLEDGQKVQAEQAWAEHHRLNAIALRCDSLWSCGDTGTIHALLFAEGIRVSGKKQRV